MNFCYLYHWKKKLVNSLVTIRLSGYSVQGNTMFHFLSPQAFEGNVYPSMDLASKRAGKLLIIHYGIIIFKDLSKKNSYKARPMTKYVIFAV